MADFINTIDLLGDDVVIDSIINRTITEFKDDTIETVGSYAFFQCNALVEVDIPNCKTLSSAAFQYCGSLRKVNSAAEAIGVELFRRGCGSMDTFILRNAEKVASLADKAGFNNTKIGSGTGYIYVPKSLVDSYKAATNWSTLSAQIRAIEDYPEITGG